MGFIFDSEGNAYFTHPTYIRYASDKCGNVVDISKSVYLYGDEFGFIHIESKDSQEKIKYSLDKFIWECFNGIITKNDVIKHVDGDKLNNKLSNLRLVKYSVNCIFRPASGESPNNI